MNINRITAPLVETDTMYVFSHFTDDQSDITAIDTITDTGTVLIGDEVGGVVVLTPSDGTVADNDEVYIATPNELYKFGTNREIYGKCRLKYVETDSGIGSLAFGFQNAVGANSIVDDTGLPKVSGSTLAIYKTDNSTVWKVCSACNGTATHTTTNKTAVAATWTELEIICRDWDGTSMQVAFKIDGEYLRDTSNVIIKHTVAIASATEMQMWAGRKLGAITNNDTVSLDYWYGATCKAP